MAPSPPMVTREWAKAAVGALAASSNYSLPLFRAREPLLQTAVPVTCPTAEVEAGVELNCMERTIFWESFLQEVDRVGFLAERAPFISPPRTFNPRRLNCWWIIEAPEEPSHIGWTIARPT